MIQLIPQNAVDRLLKGDAEILFAAFDHGLTPEIRWPHWHYPLLHGLAHACPPRVDEMIAAVLERGGNPTQAHEGLTPAMLAIGGWHPGKDDHARRKACLEQILAASTEAMDHDLLEAAVGCGYLDGVETLLASGANANHTNQEGATMLHLAFEQQDKKIARALIAAGADMKAKNRDGLTPAQTLIKNKDNDAARQAEIDDFCMDVMTAEEIGKRAHMRL